MASRGNSGMKDAFKKLQVQSPYRLSKDDPGFIAPGASQREVPQNEAPLKEVFSPSGTAHSNVLFGVAQNEVPLSQPPQSEVPQLEAVQNKVTQYEEPSFENAQFERARSEEGRSEVARSEVPQNEVTQNGLAQKEAPTDEGAQYEGAQYEGSSIEVPQIEAAQIERPQNEYERLPDDVPQIEVAQNEASNLGDSELAEDVDETRAEHSYRFFKLGRNAFSTSKLQGLSGDCFRLFLWMSLEAWPFPDSNGQVRASVSLIETRTGMAHATISRPLKALKEADLIDLRQVNFKTGNLWKVSKIAHADHPEGRNKSNRAKAAQNEVPQNELEGASKRDSSFPQDKKS